VDERQDAYGLALLDWLERGVGEEIVERDDGFLATAGGPEAYFHPVRRWLAPERQALRYVRGRVLDVGCGAGRVALELQRRGRDLVAIDVSPLAVEVARRQGVRDARVLPLERADTRLGPIDTVVMFGNNFGLLGGARHAAGLLRRLHRLTTARGRIVASTVDPYETDEPAHLAYHERNRRRGRMPGQIRMRVRYRDRATPWLDYLFVSRDEMRTLLEGTGWRVRRFLPPEGGRLYAAVIEKEPPSGR
jgi:SAM-dependent methyltransferase